VTYYSPRPGDIGITKISGTGGKLIRFGQWLNGDGFADYEHAFVVTDWPDPDTCMIIEAMPGGADYVRNWHKDEDTVYLRCPEEYRVAVSTVALRYKNIPYSVADYVALSMHRFHIHTPLLKRYIERSKSMICSQLADRAAELGGWRLFRDGRWHGDVTPGDLYRLYREQDYAH
jgi:hypothetical protein